MARSTGLEAYENHAETDFNEPRCRVFNEKVWKLINSYFAIINEIGSMTFFLLEDLSFLFCQFITKKRCLHRTNYMLMDIK